MTSPTATIRIDWDNNGNFDGLYDTVDPLVDEENVVHLTRGRSADFSAEATGSLEFVLDNDNDAYTPDRNWADGGSFEAGTGVWSTVAISGLTAAATSISQVSDVATGGGSKAGSAVLTATSNSGVSCPLPYRFLSGVTYAFTIWLKSMSGTLNCRAGLASAGTPSDIGSTSSNITTVWAAYSGTFTPSDDREDVVIFVRTNTAAAATVRVDAIQVNPGSTSNPFLEAPTKGQLVDGRPTLFHGTYLGTDYAKFYGFVERFERHPEERTVSVTCYDVLRQLSEWDVIVPAATFVGRSARDFYIAVLEEFERGNRNGILNPSFESNTTGYAVTAGALTRLTTDAAPGAGSACGQFAASAGGQLVAYTVTGTTPHWFSGQTYRFAVWLRCTAGTQDWILQVGPAGSAVSKTVTVDTTWRRYTVSVTLQLDYTDVLAGFGVALLSTAANTVRLDGATLTRGEPLYAYDDAGSGRWPNFCGNGSFDGGVLNGWYDAWGNLVSNPGFEAAATGWTNVSRVSTAPYLGSFHGSIASATTGFFNLTGTFLAGQTYTATLALRWASGANALNVTLGSSGTPADAVTIGTGLLGTAYQIYSVSWTPASNRTDARLSIVVGATGIAAFVDAVQVTRRDPNTIYDPLYSNVGPGGSGSFTSTQGIDDTVAKWGSSSQIVTTPATSTAGRVYDFNHIGVIFRGSQPYTLSLWLRATTAMPYKVGFGANKGDGTWDEASTTGTLVANTWTNVTVTWTPSADRSTSQPFQVVAYILQTNGTARQFYFDGVRVIPGSSADDFEMDHWDIPLEAGSDVFYTSAALSGSALSALSQLNGLTLARHWIRAKTADPFYDYVLEDRETFLAKTVAETVDENVESIAGLDLDRASVINVVAVNYLGGTEYYTDDASVALRGPRPGPAISGSLFFPDRTVPDVVGQALIDRYKNGAVRPTLTFHNEFPLQLERDLSDLFDLSVERHLLRHWRVVILVEDLTIAQSSRDWTTVYSCEWYPF